MNEPNSMPTSQLVTSHNAAIQSIRDKGARNLILVPGNQWTGAHAWNETYYNGANSVHMLNIVDPIDNFAFDVHQYLDNDSSGTSTQIGTNQNPDNVNIGVQRLTNFTNWLHANNRKGFLGEFAVANSRIGTGATQIGDEAINNMLNYIDANDDVWLGWAWWAAGPWWGNYMFTLEPTNLGQASQADRPALGVLQPFAAEELPGDFNYDGTVDAADYTVWRNTQGETGAGLDADSNIDGIVNELDFAAWKANFGATQGSGSLASVPEPASVCSVFAAVLAVLACRCRLEHLRT
jgi:aryl-phospho-beta-D-glucosidase BglC (GH1 family)